MGMRSLISCMARNILYRIALFYMECDLTFSCLSLYVHFRWGVALVGKFSTGHCLTCCGTPFQVQGMYRETTLR